MAGEMEEDEEYEIKFREDEELEFFTELAIHETERWIQAVTKKTFQFPEDPRKSLENGVLLCELANSLHPGAIRRINRLPTPIAGLDNVNVFLRACKSKFNMNDSQLFNPSDLEDLSQRAIGESDKLKDEYDKRLRNVAVTIYWLGRYASANCQGPQIDQTAFSALIHHKHDPEILERDFHHTSPSSTWDWSHVGAGAKAASHQNVRDGSVDSFGKESVDSLEDSFSPSRYSNTSAAARSSDRDYPVSQSANRPDSMSYTSHRRYSSTDSLNGSNHSGHSRQGSDSVDASYPTRRMSAQMTRKGSTTVDPLQFIKGKSSTNLAEMAEVQMRIAAESKKMVSETKVSEEDSVDWQANLSTWKSRRKSQSERSYQLKEDLERMEKEKEAEQTGLQTKTFSQMQEEREKRKVSSRHFYPIHDDEDDDDIFPSAKQTDNEKDKTEVLQSMHKPKAEVAPWARDSPESREQKEDNGEGEYDSGSDDDINNNDKENAISPSKNNSFLHSAPPSEWKSNDSNQFIQRTQAVQQHSNLPQSRQSHVDSKSNDMFKSSGTNVGPRTQNKIGSLMQNFQQSSNKSSAPKEGYKESIDLSARKNIFEQSRDDNSAERKWDTNQMNESKWNQYNLFNRKEQESNFSSNAMGERSSPSVRESENEDKLIQVEKTIKIKQKPNNDKGFGFFLTGGADQGRPLCVSKVSLGSAADLCELKVKDEILRVNQTDAFGKTAGDVGDIIGRAVSAGVIELRVKRTCTSDELDEEEDEEMTSSSDEGEEDLTASDSHTYKNESSTFSAKSEDMPKAPERIMERMEANVQRVNLSAPSLDNTEDSGKEDDDGPPAILRKWQRQRQREEYTFDGGPTTDYKKISLNAGIPHQDSDNSNMKMNQDSYTASHTQPNRSWDDMLNEWVTRQDHERQPDPLHSPSQGADVQSQFEARQEEMKTAYDESLKEAEKKADERMKEEQSFLQPELEKARILEERRLERRNRIQETAAALSSPPQPPQPPPSSSSPSFSNLPLPSSFLPSSTSSSALAPKPWQPSHSSHAANANSSYNPPSTSNSHMTSMTFDIGTKNDVSAPMSYTFPKQQGVIVIDPRNQAEQHQNAAPIEFQVKLPPKQEIDQSSQSFLEAERERIRQEERRRVEEERMREQREWEAKQEELRKIEEKERELREKEERFRQEREQFQREQEEFKRIREQQLREQQQMQYHAEQQQPAYPIQQQTQLQQQYQPQNQTLPQSSHPIFQNLYPESQQFQNYHQHMSQTSQPPQSKIDPIGSSEYSRGSTESPTYYQSSASNTQSSYTKPSRATTQPERPRTYRQVNSPVYSQAQSSDSIDQGKYQRDEPIMGGRFSKEDMLAMNRKAAGDFDPIRKGSENHFYQQQHQQQQQQPTQQRVPSPNSKDPNQPKGHTLNSAPKARLRDDKEWQDTNRQPSRNARGREEGNQPRRSPYGGNSQEHWMVQEAERRRLAESDGRVRLQAVVNPGPVLYPGPIKPQNDDMSNRWRNNADTSPSMPRAIRQTLLQKTSTTRGPDSGNNGYPGEQNPPHYQQSYQSHHQPHQQAMSHQHQLPRSLSPRSNNSYYSAPQDQQSKGLSHMSSNPMNKYSPNSGQPPTNLPQGPPPRQPPSNFGEGAFPVNGHQLCSHCNQELGFGAAMVIESLGIFFHLQCFKCCVCHASLGTGSQGADVRVRMNKLHCPNCYSNDEGRWHNPTNYQSRKIWIKIQ